MSDDSTKIPPGGSMQITLRRKRRKPAPKKARPAPPRGIVPVDDETPRYLRRGKVEIVFLDLATRLRSVPESSFTRNRIRLSSDTSAPVRNDAHFNEYVEQVYELPRNPFNQWALYTQTEIEQLTAALLGSRLPGSPDTLDPLSTTEANVTGRKLFNCQPLAHSTGNAHIWAGVNDKEYRLADGTAADNVVGIWADLGAEEWTRRTSSARDAEEHWNPLNLQFSNPPHGSGRLKPKVSRVTRLRHLYKTVPEGDGEVWGAYERFDTLDAVNYKITSLPAFAAAEVPFALGRGEIRVYLVPRMNLHTFATGAGTPYNANPYRWHSRMMIYPDSWQSKLDTLEELNRRPLCFILRSPLAGAAFQAVTPTITPIYWSRPFFIFGEEYPTSISLAGMLSAVIAEGDKVFYIWRRTSAAINFSTAYNPFAGIVSLDTPCT